VSRKAPSQRRKLARKPEAQSPHASDLSLHLIQAQEEERKRISRELHDEAGQGLMVLRLYLGMLVSDSTPELASKIQEAMNMLDRTIGDLRRIIARLSPRILDEMGLMPAIRKEARELSRTTGMKAHLELPENLNGADHGIEVAVYRSVQEALNNVAKHSQAKAFKVCVDTEDGSVRVLVEDDGVGISRSRGSHTRTFGLLGMRERIAALGGTVRVQSRNGRGTKLRVVLPIPSRRKRSVKAGGKIETREKPSKPEAKQATRTVAALSGLAKANFQYSNVH
jgi:signal transduction histidine kinase